MLFDRISTALHMREQRCPACYTPFEPPSSPAAGGEPASMLFCPHCARQLAAYSGPRCPACGMPQPLPTLCGTCVTDPPPWTYITYYGIYSGLLRELLLRLKLSGGLFLAPVLAALMVERLTCLPAVDVLVPVPQHPGHLRRRGYNQAHELARAVAGLTGLPLLSSALRRVKEVPSQTQLHARQRLTSPAGTFAASPELRGLRVLLLDDIITTGGTLRYASRALLDAGAENVSVVTAARTVLL